MNVGVEIDQALVNLWASAHNGPVARDIERRLLVGERVATQACPVDTGRLRGSIDHKVGVDGEGVFGELSANTEYAIYVEVGTQNTAEKAFLRPGLSAAVA